MRSYDLSCGPPVPTDGSAPAVKVLDESNGGGIHNLHVSFESEPGIDIDAKLDIPESPAKSQRSCFFQESSRMTWHRGSRSRGESF